MKHQLCKLLAATGVLLMAAASACAADYPVRPIKLIVPFAAGGTTDLAARVIARALEKAVGKAVVVENIGGAGGAIGTAKVADAVPDGYTLLFGSSSALVIAPHLYPKLRYDPRTSFVPIGEVASASFVLMVPAASSVRRFDQLVERANTVAGGLNYGSPGTGSALHLTLELMMNQAGFKAVHVPYTGTAHVYSALLGGQVDFMLDSPSGAIPMVRSGKTVALAVTSQTRERELPEVPTLQELGLKNFESLAWFAIMAPKGTPPAVTASLKGRLSEALAQTEVRTALTKAGIVPATPSGNLATTIEREYERWGRVIATRGIRFEK